MLATPTSSHLLTRFSNPSNLTRMTLHTWSHTAVKWIHPFAYLGLATLAIGTVAFTRQATVYLQPSTLHRYNRSKNNWALVTGATDGIGFGFCQELCARGFNVILHGRNRAKLETRARELNVQFPDRQTGILVRDVASSSEGIESVADEVRGIIGSTTLGQLTVLVNNVGGETRPYTALDGLTFTEVDDTIAKNAVFMTHITRVLLPVLVAGQCGLVLNVSSIASYGFPFLSVYSGTKGYVDSFTRALEAECAVEKPGVKVMALRVGQVKTAAFDVAEGLFVPTARVMAGAGLNRVGCGKTIVWGYFWHWVQGLSFSVLPRWVLMRITAAKLRALKEEEKAKAKMR